MQDNSTIKACPRDDIGAFVDGELSTQRAAELEEHIAGCHVCGVALREQKQILWAITASLESGDDLSLPPDFSKRVISNAESSVAGLRRPNEILTAVCISSALLIFVLFAFGGETWAVASALSVVAEKLFALGGFGFRIAGNLVFGFAVVARSLMAYAGFEILLAVFSGILACTVVFFSSRWALRRKSDRAVEN